MEEEKKKQDAKNLLKNYLYHNTPDGTTYCNASLDSLWIPIPSILILACRMLS